MVDRNTNGGGIVFFVRDDIPKKLVSTFFVDII